MIKVLQKSSYKNGYLLIIAAWLYTLSFIFINYWSYTSSPVRVKQRFENYLQEKETQFADFTGNTRLLYNILYERTDSSRLDLYADDMPGLFIYQPNDVGNYLLRFWNTPRVAPQEKDLAKPDGNYFVVYPNGEFELIRKTLNLGSKQIVAVGLIPIRNITFIQNKYLKTEFAGVGSLQDRYSIADNGGTINIKNGQGKILFSLQEKQMVKAKYDVLSVTLRIIALIFLLVFLNVVAGDVSKRSGAFKGFLFLFGVVVLLRVISYHIPFPFPYRHFEVFDPIVYASNIPHPSLGDLLVNIILLFWLLSFFKQNCSDRLLNIKPITTKAAWLICILLSGSLIVVSFTGADIIRSLIVDSKISFDIGNFFGLSIYTFLCFLILCFITLAFYNLSHIILLLLYKLVDIPWWGKYLAITFLGLIYLTLSLNGSFVESNLFVLAWLVLYLFITERRKTDLNRPLVRSSFFLIWLIFFAGSISALIISQNRQLERQVRKIRAQEIAEQSDPSGQAVVSIALLNFTNVFSADNFNRLLSPVSNQKIKDSLLNESFSGYINKYDTRIYTFDKSYNSLYNDDSLSYEILQNIVSTRSKSTNVPGLYYHSNGEDGFSYILRKQIKDYDGNTMGFAFLMANPKRYQQDALYPVLFSQIRDIYTEVNANYSHAVYDKGKLTESFGSYNFRLQLLDGFKIVGDFDEIREGSNSILWYNAGNNKYVVVVKQGTLMFEVITFFAYLFGTFLLILIVFQAGSLLLRSRFRWRNVKQQFRFTIRNQIQTTILFISVFSFVVIGVATISFYIAKSQQNKRERLTRAIRIMATEIEKQVSAHEMFDDVVKIYDEGASSGLQRVITDISAIHGFDVNFYDLDGQLRVSTQPYIFSKEILSKLMHPAAYHSLNFGHETQIVQQENIAGFTYLSIYVPILNEEKQPYAYISIPYLNSQGELQKEISNFLVTLINVNALIFLLAGVIAVFLTDRITSSFSIIREKMQAIHLGKVNEEISWTSADEIGVLVDEYNKMVRKLEKSALALAKSEREGAWREMARQVAHEIKNPLTPMKLSIQYLQRAIADNKPGIQQMSEKVAATLVEQIDQLAKIASDFSQFANIERVNNDVFKVNEVLQSLVDLYGANEDVRILLTNDATDAKIYADKTQIIRLFTNLLKNAIEASSLNEQALIHMHVYVQAKEVLITVADKGSGIAGEMHEKIFIPNFTTKSSGTGLGLAISKGIVEMANGRIWFKTVVDEGTTFYVSFPQVD